MESKKSGEPKANPVVLFLGGLPSDIKVEDLKEYFSKLLKHDQLSIKIKKRTSKATGGSVNKGFAYIQVNSSADADLIVMHEHYFEDRKIDVEYAYDKKEKGVRGEELHKKRICVKSIPQGTSDNDLFLLFSQYGEVVKAYLIRKPGTNQNMDYGYVHFKSAEDSARVLLQAKNTKITFKNQPIVVEKFFGSTEKFQKHRASKKDQPPKEGQTNYYAGTQPSAFRKSEDRYSSVFADSRSSRYTEYLNPQTKRKQFKKRKGFHTESSLSSVYIPGSSKFKYSREPFKPGNVLKVSSLSPRPKLQQKIIKSKKELARQLQFVCKSKFDARGGYKLDHSPEKIRYNILQRRVNEIPALNQREARAGSEPVNRDSNRSNESLSLFGKD